MKILAADIGGTNGRFGLFVWEDRKLTLVAEKAYPSRQAGFDTMLDDITYAWRAFGVAEARMLSIAAAGPLRGTRIDMTNAGFSIDGPAMKRRFPMARCVLMNDFEAQAWACLSPAMAEASVLLPGAGARGSFRADEGDGRPVAVLGAGTGLGAAWLIRGVPGFAGVSRPFVLPSEAGHAMFPFDPEDDGEELLRQGLAQRCGCAPTAEQVLSGPGLAAMHAVLTGEEAPPAEFCSRPGFGESATCALYARLMGRFCRGAALSMLPGALVIAGGVAGRTPALVRHPAFAEEFLGAPSPRRSMLESVPVWLSACPHAGLWGAAQAALTVF